MGTVKAFLIGVSDYTAARQNNLPFCKNDIALVRRTLLEGLDIDPSDIIVLGWNDTVSYKDLRRRFTFLQAWIREEDTFIFYFSGHGGNSDKGHFLCFSDTGILTQSLIDEVSKIKARNKLVILDSCYSGNYTMAPGINVNDDWIDGFVNSGCAVMASSNKNQVSWPRPEKDVSLFTYFFCLAAKHCFSIKYKEASLDEIRELVFLFLKRWNSTHLNQVQDPIFRSNIGGTIMFPVKDPKTYRVNTLFADHDDYKISSVEPVHHANVKRLRACILLKREVTPEELAGINWKIINEISLADIYQSEIAEKRFKGRPANIVFCFFGYDAEDISNSTFVYRTIWADQNQDRKHWYAPSKHSVDIQDIHIEINDGYSAIKTFEKAHTGSREKIIEQEKKIVAEIIEIAQCVIEQYNEYCNSEIDESELVVRLKPFLPEIEELFFKESDLDIPPAEIHDWAFACTALTGTVHDFTYYYNEKYLPNRTSENRRQCMDMTIRRYHEDLNRLQEEGKKLGI